MAIPLKTFDDLSFQIIKGRDEAFINFDNGYGVHIYKDVKWHDKQWRYAGVLLKDGRGYNGKYFDLVTRRYMTPEEVTAYMEEIQEL